MAESVAVRARTHWRPLVLVLLVALFVAGQVSGIGGTLTDVDRLRALLTDTGPWGPVLFVAGFAVTHAVGFPSVVLVAVAGMLWALPGAVTLSWVGAMAGTSLAYGVAAWAGHDWAMQRVPPRLRRLDRRLAERGPGLLLAVRVLLLTPAPADWLCGVASLRYRQFLTVTAVGLLPPTLVLASITGADDHRVPLVAGLALGALLLTGAVVWLRRSAPDHRR